MFEDESLIIIMGMTTNFMKITTQNYHTHF